jgi:hypothetical protein
VPAEAEAFNALIDRIGVRASFAPKTAIFYEGNPAANIYEVVGGSVLPAKP